MTTFKTGNMWDRFGEVDLFCITINGTFKADGSLVMSAGIAAQAKDKIPNIEQIAGAQLKAHYTQMPHEFPVLQYPYPFTSTDQAIGLFQVKHHYREIASIELIKRSTVQLFRYITSYPAMTVCLNFPGIGLGEDVLPIVKLLPDNVEVWEYESQ